MVNVNTDRSLSSSKMRAIEEEYKRSLDEVLVELQNQFTVKEVCEKLEISPANLSYWNLRCGIKVIRVAYIPAKGQEIVVTEGS